MTDPKVASEESGDALLAEAAGGLSGGGGYDNADNGNRPGHGAACECSQCWP